MRTLFILFAAVICFNWSTAVAQELTMEEVQRLNKPVHLNTEGYQLLQDGQAEASKTYFQQALALDSINLKYYLNLGAACNQSSDWPLAIQTYSRAIQVHPKEADLYYYRAEVYNKLKDYPRAIADFTSAIQLGGGETPRPLLYLFYFNRGVANLKLQKYAPAIKDFTETLALNNAHYGAYTNRGMARYNAQDKAGACDDWQKANALGYEQVQTYISRYCR